MSITIVPKMAQAGLPWVDAGELYALAGCNAQLMVTSHQKRRVYIAVGDLSFRMNSVQWLMYERMRRWWRRGLGPEGDPLAGAGVLPEGPLDPAEMQRVLESLLDKVGEVQGLTDGWQRSVCEEDRAECVRAIQRDLDMIVKCLSALVRRSREGAKPSATSTPDETQLVPTDGKGAAS